MLDLARVINLDTTCLETLEGLHRSLRKRGGELLICAANEHPLSLFRRSGFLTALGEENLLPDLDAALRRARQLADGLPDPETKTAGTSPAAVTA